MFAIRTLAIDALRPIYLLKEAQRSLACERSQRYVQMPLINVYKSNTPMPIVFLLFILVPLLEMVVLIRVGSVIGVLPTILLVCLTAVLGVALIRAQGLATLRRFQWRAAKGELPGQEIVDGLCLALGGAMLLTPGFVTDTLGFVLLIPGLRRYLLSFILARTSGFTSSSGFTAGARRYGANFDAKVEPDRGTRHQPSEASRRTIDGEYSRDD